MDPICFPDLSRELLVGIRGKLSQEQLNRKLKFRSNQLYRWESGHTAISWKEFVRLCEAQKIPLREACASTLGFKASLEPSSLFCKHLTGEESQDLVARRLGVSRSMVSRWRSGKAEPSLVQVLQMVHSNIYSFTEFLAQILAPEKLPSIQERLRKEREERELHYEKPWISALLLWLRTKEYNSFPEHKVGFLAKKLGISVEEEKSVMKKLLELGVVEPEGKIYAPRLRSIDTSGSVEGYRRVRSYWTERCLKYIETLPAKDPQNSWGYMVLNTSPKTMERIRQKYMAFFQDINSIVQESSEPSEGAYLLNVQFLNLEKLPR